MFSLSTIPFFPQVSSFSMRWSVERILRGFSSQVYQQYSGGKMLLLLHKHLASFLRYLLAPLFYTFTIHLLFQLNRFFMLTE